MRIDGIDTRRLKLMLDDAFAKSVAQIKKNHQNAGQVATGRTLRSLSYAVKERGTGYLAEIMGRPYFGTLETGRGPYKGGKAGAKEFNQRLIEWMKARNFNCKNEKEYLRLANYLRWKINKFGTRLYRKGGRKDIFTPVVADLTEFLEKELVIFFTATIEDKFTQGFQGFGK